jgi:hypothetical protein
MKKALLLFLAAALAACSKDASSASPKPGKLGAITRAMKPYEGEWRQIDGRSKLKIYADGGGYVIVDDGKKYPGSIENGLLRVYAPMVTMTALVTSNDHLLIGGQEYRRLEQGGAFEEAAMKTMADMRSIATALEARATDTNAYGEAAEPADVPIDAVAQVLEPTYIRRLPRTDAWATAFSVRMSSREYEIRSLGANRSADPPAPGATSHPDCDIIFANGNFTAWPEGTQSQ